MGEGILEAEDALLVVVDLQESFRRVIWHWDETVSNIVKLIKGCTVVGVPILVTEQYPKGLGPTVQEVRSVLKTQPIEKIHFGCFGEELFLNRMKQLNKRQMILCGIEAHVCVLNTALEAISEGFEVHYVVDAVSSRRMSDKEIALDRVKQSSVYVSSTEMVLFQLLKKAGTKEFKEVSRLVK
jgi:isochorismate hydrolase